MLNLLRSVVLGLTLCLAAAAPQSAHAQLRSTPAPEAQGVVRLRSAFTVPETVQRLKAAVEAKGIRFFDAIDQQALAESAKLKIGRSTLVLFGNPPLGVQFLQSNRYAGLDWPVRMLVTEDADGSVWLAWSDFAWIARRYSIKDKNAQFKMASAVALGLATEAATK
ncbi:MAG: DUF302 domain-containing protein [Hyphomicrobiaceae bacterium]|nr:DUF302 domain-containing protein [Hyphomicrobiaceae bacterium]